MDDNTQLNVVPQVKDLLGTEDVKRRFNDLLGKKATQFMASIVNCVTASPQLRQCNANSIIASAFVAASYDLPIDSNLGFAALVPYKNQKYNQQTRKWEENIEAQFQMMYKGFVQLAIRSGEYEKMNCSEVYEDELVMYNPITGECKFIDDFSKCRQRMNGETDKIVGYYAWFQLISGFRKELYMSSSEVENHANKYSYSYRYDKQKGKKSSRWTTDFDVMAKKTVIKMLLSKWGILSIEMQKAIQDDQKTYDENGNGSYGDNHPDLVEADNPFGGNALPSAHAGAGTSELEDIDITE